MKLTQELAEGASLLVTMGCGEKCPYIPGLRRDDWSLQDPKGRPLDKVRAVRDDIRNRVLSLLESEREGFARLFCPPHTKLLKELCFQSGGRGYSSLDKSCGCQIFAA